ncbi:MAG TPA: hypothetical protein VMY37_16305 [Thermoguttaceae bacterium]|nr:hypothetical protein [Thermoguttaceae bacterium]
MANELEQKALDLFGTGASVRAVAEQLGMTFYQARELRKRSALGEPDVERPAVRFDVRHPLVRTALAKELRKGFGSVQRLAHKYSCTVQQMTESIGHLEECGYNVVWDGPCVCIAKHAEPTTAQFVDQSPLTGSIRTFGIISDTHLCSKFERLDVVEAAYNAFVKAGIRSVYHAGNIVDGECRFNHYYLKAHGITDQATYCLDHYPQRSGITTYFITADDHEGWWQQREGLDFGRHLQNEARQIGRKDLVHLGYMEADVELRSRGGNAVMKIIHPGKGTAYAKSYQPQRMVESFQGGEKPSILIVGHYHKMNADICRNVRIFQAACAQDQTVWMRKHSIGADVGYWIVTVQQDKHGAVRYAHGAFENFYDRGYHVTRTA